MKVGNSPNNLFPFKCNTCIFWNFSKIVGMRPVKRLSSMPKPIKLTRFPNVIGIVPEISLASKYNSVSWVDKLPTGIGKTPPNWFVLKSNLSSLLQLVKDFKKSRLLPR